MNYQETPPSPRFRSLIKCFWSLEYDGGGEPEPIVPDGCVEIVFNLADRFRHYHESGEITPQPAALIAGQMRQCIVIGPSGRVRLFGVRFFPTGARPFFGPNMSELANRIEPLDSMWSGTGEIEDRLATAADHFARVQIIEQVLTGKVRERNEHGLLSYAILTITENKGLLPIRALGQDLSISERQLERLFAANVGLSPKSFSRIVRFQSVLRLITPRADLVDLALTHGYYDQSHFISDFRQFAGTTPGAFLERSSGLTDVFLQE
jgi:AraC-like DNA-binding protein